MLEAVQHCYFCVWIRYFLFIRCNLTLAFLTFAGSGNISKQHLPI